MPLDKYAKNLEQLVERLKNTGAKLIWATTTKVPEGEVGRIVGDEVKYNAAAVAIMQKHGIPVDDLHSISAALGADGFSKPGDIHFSGIGNDALSKQVVSAIKSHGLAGVPAPAGK